jgi:hypothetical protein
MSVTPVSDIAGRNAGSTIIKGTCSLAGCAFSARSHPHAGSRRRRCLGQSDNLHGVAAFGLDTFSGRDIVRPLAARTLATMIDA